MKKIFFLTFYFLVFCSLNAQFSKTKWGEVTQEELNYKQVDFDKEANAVILNEKGYLSIGRDGYSLQITRRIKILTEEGLKQANLSLDYYADSGIENIVAIKGQTLNEVNGKTIASPIDSKEIFDVKINELYHTKRMALPNVKVGSIIEYQYQLNSRSLYVIDAWDFQHEIPVVNSQIDMEIVGNLDYSTLLMGKQLIEKYGNRRNIKSWELKNVPSFNNVKYTYNKKNTSDRLRLQLKGYVGADGYESTLKSWTQLSKELFDSYNDYSNPSAVKTLAQQIPNGTTELETLTNVLGFFSSNFKPNQIKGIYTNKPQKKIIDERIGSVGDLNNLLYQILKVKNIHTDLVLLSSRSYGKVVTSFPYLKQFDYVVNHITLKDQSTYVIDASSINKDQFKFAPVYHFNDYGFVLSPKGENFVQLHQFTSTYEANFSYNLKGNTLQQTRNDQFDGYFYTAQLPDDALINQYIDQPIGLVFDEVNKSKIQFKEAKYRIQNTGSNDQTVDMFVLLNPLHRFVNSFSFEEENRIAPIEFNFPFLFTINVEFNIPENHELILPHDFDKTIQLNDDLIYFQKAVSSSKQLKVMYQFYLRKAVLDSKQYNELRAVHQQIIKQTEKKFILKKK